MRYTVVWLPTALAQLADLWAHSDDQREITDAADRIDDALRINPDGKAVPFGSMFVYVEEPLTVLLDVDPGDGMVSIIQVRRTQ